MITGKDFQKFLPPPEKLEEQIIEETINKIDTFLLDCINSLKSGVTPKNSRFVSSDKYYAETKDISIPDRRIFWIIEKVFKKRGICIFHDNESGFKMVAYFGKENISDT